MRDIAYIALGSNVGDRAAHLSAARAALEALPLSRVVGASAVEETAPLGAVPQGPYLNHGRRGDDALAARAAGGLLGSNAPRAANGRALGLADARSRHHASSAQRMVAEPGLTMPHPELPNRDFWQRGLAEDGEAPRPMSDLPRARPTRA